MYALLKMDIGEHVCAGTESTSGVCAHVCAYPTHIHTLSGGQDVRATDFLSLRNSL